MSIAEFSVALKNKAITEWFKTEKAAGGSASSATRTKYKEDNINNIIYATSDYRKTEQTAEKTSFLITKDTVKQLIIDFHGVAADDPILEEQANIYFAAFRAKNTGVVVQRRKITVEGSVAIYFPKISFDSITQLVNRIMNLDTGALKDKYEKGHVIGLNTELLEVTRNRLAGVDTKGSTGKAMLLQQLDNVIEYYKRLDLASANVQPAQNVKVYASVNKSIAKSGTTKYLVELQPKVANQGSAREVQATIQGIRKLFTPAGLSESALKDIIDNISKSVSDPKFADDLLKLKSSPSLLDMIHNHVISHIVGKPVEQKFNLSNVFIGEKLGKKPDLKKLNKEAKDSLVTLQKLSKSLKTKVPKKVFKEGYSLSSLQLLLDAHLQDVISANMGSGQERRVLNYRTGRLASSAKVERLSQSRDGMITAFYSYMKNPYATFSQGGRQQFPKTRDPKLLIAMSIREIAATKVGNRLRAVVV